MSNSKWLKEYYARIREEYKFSMERKDRTLDWSIGIFFVALVAYVELVRYQSPSIWRICLIVALLCFIIRLFSGSCFAYAYLKKWKHMLDQIEKHWSTGKPSLDDVKSEIERYHYTPRTTEKRVYFIKHQLVGGFFLLFLFPLFLLLFETYSCLKDLNAIFPISFLVAYLAYESIIFATNKQLSMPSENTTPPDSDDGEKMENRRKHLDGLFQIALVLVGILSAAEFQYFLIKEQENMHPYVLKVFTLPFLVLIVFWLVKELSGDRWGLVARMLLTEFCWDFWSFTLFYYLVAIYGGFQIGIILSLVLSLLLILTITWAYRRASPIMEGDRSMHSYYKSFKWGVARWIVIFCGAYLLLVFIVFPWGS